MNTSFIINSSFFNQNFLKIYEQSFFIDILNLKEIIYLNEE